jgi:hypothetical protein
MQSKPASRRQGSIGMCTSGRDWRTRLLSFAHRGVRGKLWAYDL